MKRFFVLWTFLGLGLLFVPQGFASWTAAAQEDASVDETLLRGIELLAPQPLPPTGAEVYIPEILQAAQQQVVEQAKPVLDVVEDIPNSYDKTKLRPSTDASPND